MTRPDSANAQPLAIDVEGLSRSFRGKRALVDVTLQVPTGSIFGLVGLNGAGKTTLIRHLIGSLKAQRGSVTVLGDDPVVDPTRVLKKVGYLTEEDTLPKWMRIGDLIDFMRAMYPTWDDRYVDQLCDMFALTRATPLRSLSKGQRARAGLLVAIAHRPELLVLDEPSSGLDPIARSDILEAIIRTISEDGRTVLFSSHLLEEVDRVCDSLALMREGQIVESLTTEQLESRYSEIICQQSESWLPPPELVGVFGWRRTGREWSAVLDSRIDEPSDAKLTSELSVIQRREITLHRWFTARAGTDASGGDAAPESEVSAHV